MKSASRRQVRTPVGNKTKRGAELEGTPKTPRPFDLTPGKTACTDGSSHETDDRKTHLRSRRPLQWSNIATKQQNAGDGGLSEENSFSPVQQQGHQKCTGETKAVAALSPICVNAIRHGNLVEHGEGTKSSVKRLLAPSVLSPSRRDGERASHRKSHGKTLVRNPTEDDGDTGSTEAGSCPSSPDLASSGNQIFFWSNAAFNSQPTHSETLSISAKDAASSSRSSSSASSSRNNLGGVEREDSEAESKSLEEGVFCVEENVAETDCKLKRSCQAENRQEEEGLSEVMGDTKQGLRVSEPSVVDVKVVPEERIGHPEPTALVENQAMEAATGCTTDRYDVSLTKELSFKDDKEPPFTDTESSLTADGEGHTHFPPFTSPPKKTLWAEKKSSLRPSPAINVREDDLKRGLEEIQLEIERLTERLAQLQLQKRKREEEILRQTHEKSEMAQTTSGRGKEKEAVNSEQKLLQHDQKAVAGLEGRRPKIINGASRTASVRQSISGLSQKGKPASTINLESKKSEESPRATVGRRAQGPAAATVSKLSEMRRSVSVSSWAGKRMERSTSDERTKALRRLSMSGATTSEPHLKQPQQGLKVVPNKGTPSRVVSSRYGRAITPDACRASAASGSTQQISSSKKRDRPSASCTSSPLPAQRQLSPSRSASVVCSPLKKALTSTSRSGYPSRSGFSTPIKPANMVSSSMQILPSSFSSSLLKSQDPTRLLQSPRCMSPLPRLDSPKSTAALYKCLESLLEDSKQFFKRLSPARQHRLPQLQQHEPVAMSGSSAAPASSSITTVSVSACDCSPKQLVMPREPPLRSINTCRLNEISPRDSGCVKRASERQKKRFYFAMEECNPQPLQSA